MTKRYTDNVEAYNLYLKGRYHWNKRGSVETRKAKELFEKVLTIDPNYALAYAGLADCFNMMAQNYDTLPGDTFPKAKEMALKALSIDDTLAEAHTSLAGVLQAYDWNWKEAEKEFKNAIELNPNYATAHQWYGLTLLIVGRLDEAFEETSKARELDPLSPILEIALAWVLITGGKYKEAKDICDQQIKYNPSFVAPHYVLGIIYEFIGEYDKAAPEFIAGIKDTNYYTNKEYDELIKEVELSGWEGYCRKSIDILKLKDPSQSASDIALNYFRIGEIDSAFNWLNKAYEVRDPNIMFVKNHIHHYTVRSDPRYIDIMKKIGLE